MSVYKGKPTRFVGLAPQGSDAIEVELDLYPDGTWKPASKERILRGGASEVTKAMSQRTGTRLHVRKRDGVSFLAATADKDDLVFAEVVLHPDGKYEFATKGVRFRDGVSKARARGPFHEVVQKALLQPDPTGFTFREVGVRQPNGLLNSSKPLPGGPGVLYWEADIGENSRLPQFGPGKSKP